MYELSGRCKLLKQRHVIEKANDPIISHQAEFHYVTGWHEAQEAQEAQKESGAGDGNVNAYLRSRALAHVIDHFMPIIDPGEMIVGHNFGEEWLSWDKGQAAEQLRKGLFTDKEISDFARIDMNYLNLIYPAANASGEFIRDEKARLLNEDMIFFAYLTTESHTVIGYEKVLRLGFEGILSELEGKEGAFYENLRVICRAACRMGARYVEKARGILGKDLPGYSKDDLEKIIDACGRVPAKPAGSFLQAVQSLWFAHMINSWEDSANANSLGRLDQILYPYYAADIQKGVLTGREAFDIICCLWIKLYKDYDAQQSSIGGCDGEGRPAVNELSYMMLDATEALGFVRCMSVRFSQDTERAFVTRALEVLGRLRNGIPFFFNDDVLVPALARKGIELRDARDYAIIGCVEPAIPGKSNPHAVSGHCNLIKAVEYALCGGKSLHNPGICPGLESGGIGGMHSYLDFKAEVFKQIRHIIEKSCQTLISRVPGAAANAPKPYKSLLTEGCIESGRDFNDRGALYDYYDIMLIGIPNLADSMAAVKELVFNRGLYTLSELMYHLCNNFPDEAVRLDFVNKAPKYGNDIDEVDGIACEIMECACDVLDDVSDKTGFSFHAQPFTFIYMIEHGGRTAATPDGRRDGEILANSVSPMQGRDCSGFTALLNSIAKLPALKAPGATAAIVEADPILFTEAHMPFFTGILYGAADKGLCNVQFNITDADTLIDAQRHPDKHRNLAVRVSGYSQKFELLGKELQDHIIKRTKHRAL